MWSWILGFVAAGIALGIVLVSSLMSPAAHQTAILADQSSETESSTGIQTSEVVIPSGSRTVAASATPGTITSTAQSASDTALEAARKAAEFQAAQSEEGQLFHEAKRAALSAQAAAESAAADARVAEDAKAKAEKDTLRTEFQRQLDQEYAPKFSALDDAMLAAKKDFFAKAAALRADTGLAPAARDVALQKLSDDTDWQILELNAEKNRLKEEYDDRLNSFR